MNEDTRKVVTVGVIILVAAMVLRPLCSSRVVIPPNPDVKLARTTEKAMDSAAEANEDAAAFRNAVDKYYFVALVLAVAVPLVIVFLLFKYSLQSQPEDAEIFQQIDRLRTDEVKRLTLDGEKKASDLPARLPDEG